MSKADIQMAPDFSLPLDAMTSKMGVLAMSGAGKTNTAVLIVENILRRNQQVVVLDPKGDWWGLRSSADGKSNGFSVLVLGGQHADLPIFPESGKEVADFVVREGVSCVIDVSDFESDGQRHRFTTDFALAFYKAKQRNKGPVLFVLEEADESCPQQIVEATEARMIGAIKRIAKLGRFCGICILLISQRPADVNKKVLSQIEILFAMRVWHEIEKKAIAAYLKDQVGKETAEAILASLPSLETGEGYVISPRFKINRRVKFAMRETFDAGETPKVGATRREPKTLAAVDLVRFEAQLRQTVEKAKAEDPRALQARVRQLEAELARASAQPSAPEVKLVEVPAIDAATVHRLEAAAATLQAAANEASGAAAAILNVPNALQQNRRVETKQTKPARRPDEPSTVYRHLPGSNPPLGLGKCERAILAVLAQHPEGCERGRLTLLSGYRFSGGFRNALSNLRGLGQITGGNESLMRITREGLTALGPYDPLPRGRALIDYWLNHPSLGKCERAILSALVKASPRGLDAGALTMATGYEFSGGFRNALSNLRTAGLVEGGNSEEMRASDHLFGRAVTA